jgi:hypothetical protein
MGRDSGQDSGGQDSGDTILIFLTENLGPH